MSSIDERVVEMRFDNKQFESGVKETMSTLDKLKSALNFSDSSKSFSTIETAANNVNLNGIAASLEALQNRFSLFGTFSARIVENLADTVYSTVGKIASYVEEKVVSGGMKRAMNIENAHFQLQALLKDEEKVQAVMDDAMKSVDGTAYAYDEAAKAASQFAASGLQSGEEMQQALKGIVGVAAMTNTEYEGVARIFTTVAGNGRLMGDQLLQLSSRGLNAASTIADFVNGVNDGSKSASDSVTALVKEISGGTKVTESDIRSLVSDGQISFRLFSEAMTEAFGESAERANETFTGALSNIGSALARIGAGFYSPLVAQNSEIVRMFNAIRVQVNQLKKALVYDEELGNIYALTKRLADFVLARAGEIADFLENMNFTQHITAGIALAESFINILKGLWSVIKPIGSAFKDVFLSFDIENVVDLTVKIMNLTSTMKLSEKSANNLKDAATGVFSVVKLLIDVVAKMIGVSTSAIKPAGSILDLILAIAGGIGRVLTALTNWVSESTVFNYALEGLAYVFKALMDWIASLNSQLADFANHISELESVKRLTKKIQELGDELDSWIKGKLPKFDSGIEDILNTLSDLITSGIDVAVNLIADALSDLIDLILKIDTSDAVSMFNDLKGAVKGFLSILTGNEDVNNYLKNVQTFITNIGNAFSTGNLEDKIDGFISAMTKLKNFLSNILANIAPMFSDVTLGGLISTGAGIYMIKGIITFSKSLTTLSTSIRELFGALKGTLTSMSSTLKAIQRKQYAETIKEIAKAVALLGITLTIMSFGDTDKMLEAAIALGVVATSLGVALGAFSQLGTVVAKVNNVGTLIGKALNNLAKSIKWKAIGNAFLKMAETLAIVIAAIVAVGYLYQTHPDLITNGGIIVGIIVGAMITIMGLMSTLGNVLSAGMKAFSAASIGILAVSVALNLIITAVQRIFKMELPTDYEERLWILVGLMADLAILIMATSAAALLGGGNKIQSAPILTAAIAIYVIVSALQKLFEMELPYDYKAKMSILTALFVALGALIVVVGVAGKLAGGQVKAASTILSFAVFLVAAVGALMILSMMPTSSMLKGAVALGSILVALGVALSLAGKISSSDTSKSITAMALTIAVVTASLGVLSMIPWTDLLKGAVALGSVLLAVAYSLKQASGTTDSASWKSILAMCVVIAEITFSLYVLASQPWESLLAGAGSLSAVLLSFAASLKIVSTAQFNITSILAFLAACVPMAAIAVALYFLADKPWENLLAGAASISLVLIAMAAVMAICTTVGAAAEFALAGLGALDLFIIDLAALLTSLGLVFTQLEQGEAWLDKGIAILIKIADGLVTAFGTIIKSFAETVLSALPTIGTYIGDFWNNASPFFDGLNTLNDNVGEKAKSLAEAILQISKSNLLTGVAGFLKIDMGSFGSKLSSFYEHAESFFEGVSSIPEGAAAGAASVGEMILSITKASIITGITKLLGISGDLGEFGDSLGQLGEGVSEFAEKTKDIDASKVEGGANAAKILMECAKNLPAQDGWVQKVFGKKSLSDFAAQLKDFAPALCDFAKQVTEAGIDGDSVQGAADAANIMAAMADNLPAQDGLVQAMFGKKSLSDFGQQLEDFGPKIAAFADEIKDVKATSVLQASWVAKIMANLASDLPTTGGILSVFGSNTMDLGTFGNNLVTFGEGFKGFYDSIKDIEASRLNSTISSLKSLAEFANAVATINVTPMVNFVTGMKAFGDNSINAFADAFKNSDTIVEGAMTTFVKAVNKALTKSFDSVITEMTTAGNNIVIGLNKGMLDKMSVLQNTSKALANTVNNTFCNTMKIESPSKVMIKNGQCIDEGLAQGIDKNSKSVVKSTNKMANSVEDEVRDVLEIHSPSEVLKKLGYNVPEGLAEGIDKGTINVVKVCKTLGVDSATAIKNGLGTKEEWEKYGGGIGTVLAKVADDASSATKDISFSNEQLYDTLYNNSLKTAKAEETTADSISESVASIVDSNDTLVKSETSTTKAIEKTKKEAIAAEDEYWAKLLKIKQEGADADTYKDMELVAFKEKMLEDTNEIYQNYLDEWQSTTDSIAESLDLFDELDEKEAKSKEEIVKNLQDQIKAIDEYALVMATLDQRLEGTKLLEYLQTLGVDSLAQLKVINSMTDSELTNYSNLYDTKLASANVAAAAQLTTLRTETETKLQELFGAVNTQVNLVDFGAMFDGTLESLTSFVNQCIAPFETGATDIADAAKTMAESAVEGLETGLSEFDGESVGSIVTEAVSDAKTEELKAESESVGEYTVEGIGEGISNSTAAEEAISEVIDNVVEAAQTEGEIQSPSQLMAREVGTYLTEGIGVGIVDGLSTLSSYVSETIQGITEMFVSGTETQDLTTAGSNMIKSISSSIEKNYPDFKIMGGKLMINLSDGVISKQSLLISTTTTTINKILTAIQNKIPEFYKKGTLSVEQFIKAFTDNYQKVYNIGMTFTQKAIEGCNSVIENFYTIGANGGQGFVNGLSSKMSAATSAGASIGRAAYEAAMRSLDEHSPSKKMGQVGEYAGLGFVNALMTYVAKSAQAGEEVGTAAIQGVTTSINDIADPIIRPVMDLSEIQSGLDDINSLFATTRFNISDVYAKAADISSLFGSAEEAINPTIEVTVDNESVASTISELRGDIADLKSAMTNLQVVLDSGTLVGQLINPIDNALGRRQVYKGRGI